MMNFQLPFRTRCEYVNYPVNPTSMAVNRFDEDNGGLQLVTSRIYRHPASLELRILGINPIPFRYCNLQVHYISSCFDYLNPISHVVQDFNIQSACWALIYILYTPIFAQLLFTPNSRLAISCMPLARGLPVYDECHYCNFS